MINAQFPPFSFTVESHGTRVLSRLNARKKTRKVGIKRDQTAIQLLRWPFIFPVGVIFGADKETRRRFFSSSPPGFFFSLSVCVGSCVSGTFLFFLNAVLVPKQNFSLHLLSGAIPSLARGVRSLTRSFPLPSLI